MRADGVLHLRGFVRQLVRVRQVLQVTATTSGRTGDRGPVRARVTPGVASVSRQRHSVVGTL